MSLKCKKPQLKEITWIFSSFLIRQSFKWYRCESDMSFYKWDVIWNCVNNPFNLGFIGSCTAREYPSNPDILGPGVCRTRRYLSSCSSSGGSSSLLLLSSSSLAGTRWIIHYLLSLWRGSSIPLVVDHLKYILSSSPLVGTRWTILYLYLLPR